MTGRQQLYQKLLEADRNSKENRLNLQADVSEGEAQFVLTLRRYIADKFLMESLPADEDRIYDLGRSSFMKLQKMKDAGMLGDEINTGCSGASSAAVRKALFFMALQRDLLVKFTSNEIESAETVGDIIALCISYRKAN